MHEEQTPESPAAPLDIWSRTFSRFEESPRLAMVRDGLTRRVAAHPAIAAGIAAAIGVMALVALYWRLSLTVAKSSDDAALILYAEDILHGNLTLHGWTLPSDSLYLTAIPAYVLGRLFLVPMTTLLYLIPALSYAVLVIACVAIAWKKTDADHRVLSALLVFAVIALPSIFSPGPPVQGDGDHTLTVLCILAGFYALSGDYSGVRPITLLILTSTVLTAAAVGDPLALIAGAFPLIWIGVRCWRSGEVTRGRNLLVVGGAALVFSTLIRWVIPLMGGFKSIDPNLSFVAMNGLRDSFYYAASTILDLFGADFFAHPAFSFDTALVLAHLLTAGFVVYLVYRSSAVWSEGNGDLLPQLLLTALVMNLAARLFFAAPSDDTQGFTVPVTPVLFFSALIAGMWWYKAGISQKFLRVVLPVVLACYLTSFLRQALRPAAQREDAMIAFLEKNQLTKGYGIYAHAAILTVLSEGKVNVIPVDKAQGGRMAPVDLRSSSLWYDDKDATFFIFGPEDYVLNPKVAARTWGRKPNHMDIIGLDRLWRWDAPIQFPEHK